MYGTRKNKEKFQVFKEYFYKFEILYGVGNC